MNINEYINTYEWIYVAFYKKPNKGSVDKVSYFLHDLSSKSFLCSFLCRKGQRKVKSWDISQKTDNDSTYNSYFYNHIMWISLTSSKSVDYISYYRCNEIASGDVSTQINVFAERFFVQVWIYWILCVGIPTAMIYAEIWNLLTKSGLTVLWGLRTTHMKN